MVADIAKAIAPNSTPTLASKLSDFKLQHGRIDTRQNSSMILSSLVSISAGGSLGPEAPMVQVTGSSGTWFADRLKLQDEDLRSIANFIC